MSHQKVFEQFKEKAKNASPLGGTLKFMVDENAVFIDGNGEQNTLSMDDLEADCTITVSTEILEMFGVRITETMCFHSPGYVRARKAT